MATNRHKQAIANGLAEAFHSHTPQESLQSLIHQYGVYRVYMSTIDSRNVDIVRFFVENCGIELKDITPYDPKYAFDYRGSFEGRSIFICMFYLLNAFTLETQVNERKALFDILRYFIDEKHVDFTIVRRPRSFEPTWDGNYYTPAIDFMAEMGQTDVVNFLIDRGVIIRTIGGIKNAFTLGHFETAISMLPHLPSELLNKLYRDVSCMIQDPKFSLIARFLLDYGAEPSSVHSEVIYFKEYVKLRDYTPWTDDSIEMEGLHNILGHILVNPRRVRVCCS